MRPQVNPQSGVITRIEPQKKHKNRLSVFIDDAFAFGVDQETAIEHDLKTGHAVSAEQWAQITEADEYRRGLIRAYRLLTRRAHSEHELREKLAHIDFPEVTIDKIIARLHEQNYLDDHEFARQYCDFRLRKKPMGRRLLRVDLIKKGLSDEVVACALDAAFGKTSEFDFAALALEKRRNHFAKFEEKQARQKKIAFLQSRGFDWEVIRAAV